MTSTKYPRLEDITPLEDFVLRLTFDNGEKRIYDFSINFQHPYYAGLKDAEYFKAVTVNNGEIEWATGEDFCPHTLYEKSEPVEE